MILPGTKADLLNCRWNEWITRLLVHLWVSSILATYITRLATHITETNGMLTPFDFLYPQKA